MREKTPQAVAPETQQFGKEAFNKSEDTVIRWLGNAGIFINSHGTCIMIDPLLEGFDMPLLINLPLALENVPYLDAVLITHSDNDHYSQVTCRALSKVCNIFHATHYVAELMEEEQLKGVQGHDIHKIFYVDDIRVALTPVDHTWQNELMKFNRIFEKRDCCGFYINTPDGTIWIVGDSRLLEEQLHMPEPDVIVFDFSDDSWHIGLENAVKLANTYLNADLILSHWGSVNAPEIKAFNADPKDLSGRIINQQRIHIVAPGEPFKL